MKNLLQINSSIFSSSGQSSRLAERFVAAWRAANPGASVTVRDLASAPVPQLDAARFGAFIAKPEERTALQQATANYSDALIAELKAADVGFVYAEGLAISEEGKNASLARAHRKLGDITAPEAIAA
jgi:FMN-dependent NADH-azoreductase